MACKRVGAQWLTVKPVGFRSVVRKASCNDVSRTESVMQVDFLQVPRHPSGSLTRPGGSTACDSSWQVGNRTGHLLGIGEEERRNRAYDPVVHKDVLAEDERAFS
jgi:hypothetical protein